MEAEAENKRTTNELLIQGEQIFQGFKFAGYSLAEIDIIISTLQSLKIAMITEIHFQEKVMPILKKQ